MDSLSQAALGAAIGVAVMGRRTAVWKAAAWGALVGTLPDLDAVIDHGDPVANMTLHRAETHAPFWLTLASLPIAAGIARLSGEWRQWRRWWLMVWLALVTHPLLDGFTVYGTQLLLPFSERPLGQGSLFIIDPLYTLPLLLGVWVALRSRHAAGPAPDPGHAAGAASRRGLAWNAAGLALSCAYIAWSVGAQAWVEQRVRAELRADPATRALADAPLLATPAPFNTLLWRLVLVDEGGDRYLEGFKGLLDGGRATRWDAFVRGEALASGFEASWPLQRMRWFTHGFYKLAPGEGGAVRITDLRMGQEPHYVFAFEVPRPPAGAARMPPGAAAGPLDAVAAAAARPEEPAPTRAVGGRLPLAEGFRWLGARLLGADVAPPR